MIDFTKVEQPVEGWTLDKLRNLRTMSRLSAFWSISLIRRRDGRVVEAVEPSLEQAWQGAVCAAQIADRD